MKTQIITLESHDDLISVRDRLSWAKTPRILLIWPKGEPVDLRPLDLRVLQRHADSLGAQLAIVTRGDSIRRQAEALGLPVFESSASAQRESWPSHPARVRRAVRPPRRDLRALRGEALPAEASWRSNLLTRIVAFGMGVLAVLALVALFIPRASITLYPESRLQRLDFTVSAGSQSDAALLGGVVPVRKETVTLSGSRSMVVSGQINLPQSPARGMVRFRNLGQSEVAIPAGTLVSTAADPPIQFKTLYDTHINAGVDQYVETPVEAVEPGAMGNVEAGTIGAVEGSLGLLAAVENPNATSGGSSRTVTGPGQSDRERLRAGLMKELTAQADKELSGRLSQQDFLLPDTLALAQTLEEVYDPPPGQPGTKLTLTARAEFSVELVSVADIARLAESALGAAQPQGFSAVPGSLTWGPLTAPAQAADGLIHWQMRAERRLLRSLDPVFIAGFVRGRSPQDAADRLGRAFDWMSPPKVSVTPSWWPWLPLLPFRTSVVFQ